MSAATSTSRGGAQPSLLRRLAHTPLRDIVRGRLSGRTDVKRLVAAADLPVPLASIVLEVARRSRLWRLERADVADELIAHFVDGLRAGSSPQALADAFGPARQAARLIRRAKRRNRPLLWKAWVRSVQAVGLLIGLLVVIYIVAAIRLFTGTPVMAHDYLADVNAKARAVPQTQRAWPMYRTALVALGEMPQEVKDHVVRPGQQEWDHVARYIETHDESLELVRQAAARPGLGYIVGHVIDEADLALWPERASDSDNRNLTIGLFGILLPHLSELHKLSRLLALDAHRAAATGDGTLATADIEASLGLAEHARETPFIINELVSLGQITLALDTLGEILAKHPELFTDSQLQALAHRLSAVHGGRVQLRLDGEKLGFQDFVQQLYTDDGHGDGRLTAQGLQSLGYLDGMAAQVTDVPPMRVGPLGPVLGLVIAGRREMTEESSRLYALAEAEFAKPLWQQDVSRLDREVEQIHRSPLYTARYLPVALLMPALGKAGVRPQLVTQQRDAMLVVIGLELYRRRSGSWPQSLDMLVPDLLPAVPPDRFDGRPLRYRLIDGKPLLYSIGSDRDDDGGRPPLDRRGRLTPKLGARVVEDPAKAVDGDWVLWPPVLEPAGGSGSSGRDGG
ncbi:MAG: hypothetical protein O7F17_08935 [Planctomycetota bacterium]|nr:hypothetical protein [Planctomycetota bacterium]